MKIKNKSALIIIDQQKGIANPSLGCRNNENAESEMLSLLLQWRKLNWPIVHVKHRSSQADSVFWPHQEGFEFKPEFLPIEHEHVIEKTTPCAFTKTHLEQFLNQQSITTIVVVGASTNNSVEATARTGGCIGFNVIVIENACFAFAKSDYFGVKRTAEEVHAMSLANLHNEYALVVHSSEMEF
jgi:nicotinamidase-related amidase